MKDNSEEALLRRAAGAIRKLIGFVFVALAAGVLGGLAAGKAIWKKPCDHPAPEYILLEKNNGTFQVLTNHELVIHELVITNNGTFTIHFPNFPDSKKIKWGGQATNSP